MKAYPSLIQNGEGFLRTAEGRSKAASKHFNDRSYSNPLFSRCDGVGRHFQYLFWGFDALEEAFRANQKAEVHFAKLRQKQIPFDYELASRLKSLKGDLLRSVKLAQGSPQNAEKYGLFAGLSEGQHEELLTSIQKRVSVVEQLLKTVDDF